MPFGWCAVPEKRYQESSIIPVEDDAKSPDRLMRKVELQDAELAALRQALELGQKQWQSQRENLTKELEAQAAKISLMQAET